MDKKPIFTVFTPVFNRRHTIHRVYESLLSQSLKDFEWLIVDDGSTDNLEEIVNTWVSDKKLEIIYFKQPNMGKHVAINNAVKLANGRFFLIFDSDDRCKKEALEIFKKEFDSIPAPEVKKFAGIVALAEFPNGQIIGKKFPKQPLEGGIYQVFSKYRITGDKWNCIRTDIMQEHPFPVYENEKFISEGLIWNRISDKYIFKFINKSLLIQEYLNDGLSKNLLKHKLRSPQGTLLYYEEALVRYTSISSKTRALINLYRYKIHFQKEKKTIHLHELIAYLFGFALYLSDNYRLNKT